MSSWANLHSQPLGKKKEIPIRMYLNPLTSEYSDALLSFLYGFVYTQRNAEPFYIHDAFGQFQPLLQTNPILHYVKEVPSAGSNLYTDPSVASLINSLSLNALRKSVTSIFNYNAETDANVRQFLLNMGLLQQQNFDVGIVLDVSGCVPAVLSHLTALQKRTNKKTLKIFVATDQMDLLREFATKGHPSWTFVSMMRQNAPTDRKYTLMKTLAEIRLLRGIEYVAVRFASPLGKLIYLTSQKITTESQILSLDGRGWKAAE
jgi:hypothetical protein